MINKVGFIVLIAIVVSSCMKDDFSNRKNYKPKFVVEGWIEEGGYPHVILTHNLPFFTKVDSAQLTEVVIRWAKVSVSDGEKTEVLTSGKDDGVFPPYIYKGSDLIGKAGKTYTLTIEYAGNILTAKTVIPRPVPIDSLWFIAKEDNTMQQLNLRFTDNLAEKNYYRIFTKIEQEKQFYPTLLSNQDDKYFNGKQLTLTINRGPKNNLTIKNNPYFATDDTVYVKFAAIPKEGFDFWDSFNNEVLNSSNPLIGSTKELKHNIEGEGIGIWCGYGATIYKVVAK